MLTVAELIDLLAVDDSDLRRRAADSLFERGAEAAPQMVAKVPQVKPSPQYALLNDTLRRMGHEAFGPVRDALAAAQTDDERRTFAWIYTGLGETALPNYTEALRDSSDEVRWRSIGAIGALKTAGLPAAPAIVPFLADREPRIQRSAISTLVAMGPAVAPLLQQTRAAGPAHARRIALRGLADLGGDRYLSNTDRYLVERLIRIKLTDDHPKPITGCFLSWIAVASPDQQSVMELFGLTSSWPATFALGTSAADHDGHGPYEGLGHLSRVFVSPAVDGWTIIAGPWCDPVDDERRDDVLDLCVRASAEFGKAQAYWYGEQNDGSAWLVAENGVLLRRACKTGEAIDEEVDLGEPLPLEVALLAAAEDEDERDYVLWDFAPTLAAALSVNPRALDANTVCQGHGWLALTPIGLTLGHPPGALQF